MNKCYDCQCEYEQLGDNIIVEQRCISCQVQFRLRGANAVHQYAKEKGITIQQAQTIKGKPWAWWKSR